MCSPLGLILERIKNKKNDIYFSGLQSDLKILLINNGFLNKIHINENKHDSNHIPYKTFSIENKDEFVEYLDENVLDCLKREDIKINYKEFRRIMVEMFINVKMHTTSKEATTCGYYNSTSKEIYFTITNIGMTIRNNIEERNGYIFNSCIEAIQWAVKKSNSTRKSDTPGGLGFFISRDFVKQHNGSMSVISGKGYWQETDGIVCTKNMDVTFPGTIVIFKLNLFEIIEELPLVENEIFSIIDLLGDDI